MATHNTQSKSIKSSDQSPGTCGCCPCGRPCVPLSPPLPLSLPPPEFWSRSWFPECDCDRGMKGTDESMFDRCVYVHEGRRVLGDSDVGSKEEDVGKGMGGGSEDVVSGDVKEPLPRGPARFLKKNGAKPLEAELSRYDSGVGLPLGLPLR